MKTLLKKVLQFYDEVKAEVQRIIWPSRKDLMQSTIMVLICVLAASLVCLIVDYGIHSIIKLLLKI